jgi:pimeloyl-ACP methyl ester carboxylesterase
MTSHEFHRIDEANIELTRMGAGPPLLLLEGEEQRERAMPFVAELAKRYEVLIPSPPGFGKSNRPDFITGMDDIAYLYNALLQELDLRAVTVVGFSMGGWIAAEMASKTHERLAKLVLVSPYGVKHGGVTDRDILDIWTLHPQKVAAALWREPAKSKRDFSAWSDEELLVVARNNESFARFCWQPYMHNPKLRHRLGAVRVPAHFIWGANDGVTPPDYGRKYAALFAKTSFQTIDEAGHYPHVEQPEAFAAALNKALG